MNDCFAGVQQDFLICITVHKAANTGVPRGELYVKVFLDKINKVTRTQANTENPFFNEYFVFEFHCTLTELLRLTVLFQLKKYLLYKKNVIVGELLIDLHSVWSQPGHNYFKKWGRLESPIDEHTEIEQENENVGYLQIDLAIVSQHSTLRTDLLRNDPMADNLSSLIPHEDHDDIKNNMLQDLSSFSQSNIRYFVTFYRGMFVKKSTYMLQFSFAGFKGKTHVAKHTTTPVWNQQISFAWVYPSLAQRFLILIFWKEHLQWNMLAEYELSIEEISFSHKPALGPTYINFYDPVNPLNYVGRVLMQLNTAMLGEDQPSHVLNTHMVPGLVETRNWVDDTFLVEFLPLMGDHIKTSYTHYSFDIKMAEYSSNVREGELKTPAGKLRSLQNSKYFRQETTFNSCRVRVHLPDNRVKFGGDYFIAEIIDYMRSELDTFKNFQLKSTNQHQNQAKCLKFILSSIMQKMKTGVFTHRLDYKLGNEDTTWDKNKQIYLLDYFTKMPQNLRALRDQLKFTYQEHLDATIVEIVNEMQRLIGDISSLLSMLRLQDDWPELVLTLSTGGKQVGICRLNAKHFMNLEKHKDHPSIDKCWKVKSFIFKNVSCVHSCTNCGCNVAIVLGCLGIVLERERLDFLSCIAGDWASPEVMGWLPNVVQTHFCCNVYVHQAKVHPGADKKTIFDGHVRVFFAGQAAETYAVHATPSPVWDAVITFKTLTLPGSFNWYLQNPPIIALEFYSSATDVIATGHTVVSVISSGRDIEARLADESRCWDRGPLHKLLKLKHVSPPPLKWVPVARGGIIQAEVLMSAELKELGGPEVHKAENHPTVTTGIPLAIRPNMLNYVLEVIFVGMRNYTKTSLSLAGKRRIKVMMADLVLLSGLSSSRVSNSINFLVAYASGIVSLPDQQEYWPAIIATDVLVNNFCNDMILGAAMVPNSINFLQKDATKCVKKHAESSAATSTVIVYHIDETEETEDDRDKMASKIDSWWKRIMIALGLRTITYANRDALKYDEYAETSDLYEDIRFTWWTKFYNAMHGDQEHSSHRCKHSLTIYPNELEKQPQFGFLQDWAVPVPLVHGVKYKKQGPPKEDVYATLKLQIKLTPCHCDALKHDGAGDMLRPLSATRNPRQQTIIKSLTDRVLLTVRVYVIQGQQIRPRDLTSSSDCYVRLMLGGKMVSDQAHYIPNQSSPVFGRFFELETALPADPMLEVAIYDHDRHCKELIGYTVIDLEDRWHSKHRARVGIPQEYTQLGYNQWHDVMFPSQLLTKLCQERGIQPPYFYGSVIEVDGMLFGDETVISKAEELKERLSLTVLKNLERLPSFGYKLVPEHVETRSLYHDDHPGVEQGKVQLWIELFEMSMTTPSPVDITPIPPIGYEVRIVVKNLGSLQFGDKNIFGKLMSDVYVIGWCQDMNKNQKTDIHYRSFAGAAAFNWRMIFALKYSPNEDMMVIRRKGGLRQEIEIKKPPIIYLQVWDKDVVTRDEYLGALELNLSNLPVPYAFEKTCQSYPNSRMRLNLFSRKSIKGWFPLIGPPKKPAGLTSTLSGKIELQLDICTEVEASNSPAGLGHNPPMALEKPYRDETAFNPLKHPWKSVHLILWPAIRKYVFIAIFIVLMGLGLVLFFANLPNKIMSIPLE